MLSEPVRHFNTVAPQEVASSGIQSTHMDFGLTVDSLLIDRV